MKMSIKIVFIGAGSASFGRAMIADILGSAELNRTDCTLVLVDIDEGALDRSYRLATLIKRYYNSPTNIEKFTDRLEALSNADYVIISVERKRYELWDQDFALPLKYGFKAIEGECGGPGAMFHAIRNFEAVVPICKDVEKLCPDALVMNFTNPVTRVTMAANYLTEANVVGLCHGVFMAQRLITGVLGKPLEELDIVSGGMNHFYWILKISDKETGQDLYPEFKKRVQEGRVALQPLNRRMLDIFGLLTYPEDSHPGEYLSFAYDVTGPKWKFRKVEMFEERDEEYYEYILFHERGGWQKIYLDPFLMGEKPLDERLASRTEEIAIPIICDIEFDRNNHRPAVNVLNCGNYIENLPDDAVVEVPAIVNAKGIIPQEVGSLPEALAAFIRTQVSIQKLLIEAYRQRSKNLLLQALLLDPVVDSVSRAEKFLDEMLELQSEWLPRFE